MFEEASRRKLRYDTPRGALAVEDLWGLPLSSPTKVSLDSIAVGLHHQMKNENISFVNPERMTDSELQLKFDVVRHVIEVRKRELEEAAKERSKAEQKQKILEIIARKRDQNLENQPIEDLEAMIANL